MEYIQSFLATPLWNDKTVGDFLSSEFLASFFGSVLAAIAILFVGWTIAAWLSRRVRKIGHSQKHLDDTLLNFLGSIIRYIILAFTILIVLNTVGVQTTSVVAAVGAAGLAIGLALQGTLSNVAAGVMLIMFRPLKLGDRFEHGWCANFRVCGGQDGHGQRRDPELYGIG